jgi:hypothetical protein
MTSGATDRAINEANRLIVRLAGQNDRLMTLAVRFQTHNSEEFYTEECDYIAAKILRHLAS